MEGRRTRNRSTITSAPASHNVNVTGKRSSSSLNTRNVSPGRRASPAQRASPGRTRRSSRPRSAAAKTAPSATTIVVKPASGAAPSPVKETTGSPSPKSSSKTRIPTAPGSNITAPDKTSPRLAGKSSSSIHSTYSSSSTHKTVEIRSTVSALDTEISKLTDYIRRSVSKTLTGNNKREGTHTPTTNTEGESRYSRSISRSVYDDDNYSKAEFSDGETNGGGDDDEPLGDHFKSFNASAQHSYSTSALGKSCRQLEIPREFGGWLGATVLMILTPCIVYYLQWCCQKDKCNFKIPNFANAMKSDYLLKSLFSTNAVGAYIAFQMGVFVLSALLFGRRVRLSTDRIGSGISYNTEYKFNALPIAIVMTLVAGIAEYLQFPVADFVVKHQLRFCFYGFVNAFVVALWAYLRVDLLKVKTNTQVNIYGKSGNMLIDYAQGRQLNPKWLDLVDFKQVFYRSALLLTLLYAECYMYKQLMLPAAVAGERGGVWNLATYFYYNVRYDAAALLTTGMVLLYILDAIVFEHHLASSFELQGEGFGALLLLRYAATPYLLTAVARYFCEQQFVRQPQVVIPLACKYAAYVSIVLLLVGLALKRLSSAVKYKYRIDPMNAYFNGIDTIHTFQGRRLLLGSLWGKMRQPNYAGDLLALCSLTLPLFLRFAWPPLLCVALLCLVLLHRTQRLHTRNMSRYHSSWVRYCNQVRYYVLPHVY